MPKPLIKNNNLHDVINENINLLSKIDPTIKAKLINHTSKDKYLSFDWQILESSILNSLSMLEQKFLSLKKKIKKNEGFRNKPYLDSLGHPTIGYGHLITNKEKKTLKGKFSKKYLLQLFDKDFQKALTDYKKNFNHKSILQTF